MRAEWFSIVVVACGSPDDARTTDGAVADDTPDAPDSVATFPSSDPFDGSALDSSWTRLHPELADIEVTGGKLAIHLTTARLWFADSEAVLVSKRVTGNFKVTSTIRARSASNPAAPPTLAVSLSGLMARDPAGTGAGAENYVFIVAGRDSDGLAVETKSTVDNNSTFEGPDWPSGDAELRLCRVANTFALYKREIGSTTWISAATFVRNLGPTVEAGPNSYALSGPDLRTTWDEVVFAPALSDADCVLD